jgi:hypothetical protein
MTLLQRRDKALAEARNRLWQETRQRLQDNWATDEFFPYAVHVYGPLAPPEAK